MKSIKNNISWLLSQNWSGLITATVTGLVGLGLWTLSCMLAGAANTALLILSGVIGVLTIMLFLGAFFHLYKLAKHLRLFPPPGKLVDVGGYKMHIMAEGLSQDQPTLVWIPGSHDQGLAYHHLHRIMARECRSILFDRAGSGWSDVGPFPRSLPREVEELHTLLKIAGEKGPFIIIAHSLGGLLAQNFADIHPGQTAGLLLLDSACPDASIYTSFLTGNSIPGNSLGMWFLTAFGIAWIVTGGMLKNNPPWLAIYQDEIKPQVLLGNCQPKLSIGFMSALKALIDSPFDMIKGQGRLGDLPIISIIPPAALEDQIAEAQQLLPNLSERQVSNFIHMRIDSQNQTARLSSKGEQYFSPENTTHGFPFEAPDFTLDMVRKIISRVKKTG